MTYPLSAELRERFPRSIQEAFERRPALGCRFRDAQTDEVVTDALRVELRAVTGPDDPRVGVRGPSGIVSFHGLPGLRGFEAPDAGLPEPAEESLEFALSVDDPGGRFLPLGARIDLPKEEPHILEVPLFAAARYEPPRGWAALRGRAVLWSGQGDLPEEAAGAPASWARVRVALEGTPMAVGVSDERGEFLLTFPLPSLLDAIGGAGGAPSALEDRSWDVEVEVAWEEAVRVAVPGSRAPEVGSIHGQAARQVVTTWEEDGSTTVEDRWAGKVRYGSITTIGTDGREALWVRVPGQP